MCLYHCRHSFYELFLFGLFLLIYCCHNRECLRCNGILIISKAKSTVYSSPLLAPWLQHMGKHFPLSLLTPYLLSSQWQSPHQCGVHIGLYTLSSRQGLCIGYCIMKGVSERCIARLLLTSLGQIEQTILLLEHVNYFTTMQIHIKIMTGI